MERAKLIASVLGWFFAGVGITWLLGLVFSWEREIMAGSALNMGAFLAVAFGMIGYLIRRTNRAI